MKNNEDLIRVKLVVVGDGQVGKTSLLLSYAKNNFSQKYQPTVFDSLSTTISVSGHQINLGLWDTAGQEQYSSIRRLAYPNTDIFMIVFSVVNPDSFVNARKKWYPQVMQCCPSATIQFVGNKCDLRNSKSMPANNIQNVIHNETGCIYNECSAKTKQNLRQVFESAVFKVVQKKYGINIQIKAKKEDRNSSQKCCVIY